MCMVNHYQSCLFQPFFQFENILILNGGRISGVLINLAKIKAKTKFLLVYSVRKGVQYAEIWKFVLRWFIYHLFDFFPKFEKFSIFRVWLRVVSIGRSGRFRPLASIFLIQLEFFIHKKPSFWLIWNIIPDIIWL